MVFPAKGKVRGWVVGYVLKGTEDKRKMKGEELVCFMPTLAHNVLLSSTVKR